MPSKYKALNDASRLDHMDLTGPESESNNSKFNPDLALPPGEIIKEAIFAYNLTKKEVALKLELEQSDLSLLLIGSLAISPNLAKKLSELFNRPELFWLKLEANYRANIVHLHMKNRAKEIFTKEKNK